MATAPLNAKRARILVFLTGTNPDTARGGIGVVMAGYSAALRRVGLEHEIIPTYDPTVFCGKWLPWLKAFPRLIRAVSRSRKSGLDPVVYSHAGAGVSLLRESLVLKVARLYGVKTMMQIHAPQIDNYLDSSVGRYLLRLVLSPVNVVCLLTPWWKQRMEYAGIHGTLIVVPNPLPPELEKIATEEKISEQHRSREQLTLLAMARLVPGKGVDVAIRAMIELPAYVHLVVAGDGDQLSALKSLAHEIGVADRVEFTGWVSGEEKRRLLRQADIFCLPSTNDAFPISMVEAMCHGLPVVAVKWGGIPDIVSDGRTGILIERSEPALVAQAVRMLLDLSRRCEMGIQAKKWVREISSAEMVGQLIAKTLVDLPANR